MTGGGKGPGGGAVPLLPATSPPCHSERSRSAAKNPSLLSLPNPASPCLPSPRSRYATIPRFVTRPPRPDGEDQRDDQNRLHRCWQQRLRAEPAARSLHFPRVAH